MLIQELLEAKKGKKHKKKSVHKPELDDVEDRPEDADSDKVPHILMQLRKALDVNGNYPITFKDGSQSKLSMNQIVDFIKKYIVARPDEKELMQNKAASNFSGFLSVLNEPEKEKFKHKIKGDRYMTSFAGDLDDK